MKESDVNIAIKADAGELTKTMQSVSKQAETIAAKMADGAKKTSQLGGAIKGQLVGALSSAASGAGGLGKALSTAMTTGLGPIGLVTTAVTAIGGALKSAMDKSQAFGDFMTRIFAQVGAALSYILDTSNWGAGFADGLKQAIEVAGELADASDNAGTYTMEWAAKQSDLNAVLAESQAIMADGTATAKERAAAVEAAKKAADDYAREAAKYTAARHAEIEATVKQVAAARQLTLTQEELNYIISEGITDTDALKAAGGNYAAFADALNDATQSNLIEIRRDIKETAREASQFARRVAALANKTTGGEKVKIETEISLPTGSVADLKKRLKEAAARQELTIPASIDWYKIQGEIDELNRKLKGESDMLTPILPVKLDVTDVTKDLKLVKKEVESALTPDIAKECQNAFKGLGQVVQAVGQDSKVAAAGVQALAIAEQVAAMAAAIRTASEGDPYTVAARIIAAAAAVASSIATIQSIANQSFAAGGIVAGASDSGDRVLVRANAGEMVLTKGQQGRLFALLNSGGAPSAGGNVTFRVSGRDLVGVLEANTRYNERTL